jgi:hypothetical protein
VLTLRIQQRRQQVKASDELKLAEGKACLSGRWISSNR